MNASSEQRWNRGAWLTLAVAAGLLLGPLAATLLGLRYPTDGWTGFQDLTTGVYRMEAPVSGAPSPLRAGDQVDAINGQPLRGDQLAPFPPDLRAGQVLRYSLVRDSQRMEVDVTLVQRSLDDYWRYALASIPRSPATTLVPVINFLVALAVFLLRPGSAAARYLLVIFSYYGPGAILWGPETHLYSQTYPLAMSMLLAIPPSGWTWLFFPSFTLLALNLPVRKWPLTRFPRLVPALLYGVPFISNAVYAYLFYSGREARLAADVVQWMYAPVVLAFLAALFSGLAHNFLTLKAPVARAQLRWVAFGMGIGWGVPIGAAVIELSLGTLNATSWASTLLWLTVLLPVSLAIAVTRYRLFDIDVIFRRTLVYSALSAVLALTYFGSVLVLEGGLRALTGQAQNSLVVVVSTLAIAALFVPVRARVQRAIDSRFYRRKYDAARTLAAFAASARDEVDMEHLSASLLAVVDETMQPESVYLWVPTKGPVRANRPDYGREP
jgi:hypothetical protein